MTSGTDTTLPGPAADEARRLRRPRDDRVVAGVASGLAAYFGLRPAIYRIAFAALALAGGAGFVLYAVAALVIPAEGADESIAEEFLRRHRDQPVVLVGLGIVGVVAISIVSAQGGAGWGWPLAGPLGFVLLVGLAGVALWKVSQRDRGTSAAPTERRPSLFLPGLGILLAAAGIGALLDALDVVDVPLTAALAVGVVLVGVLITVGGLTSRRVAGLIPLGLLLAVGLLVTGAAGIGEGGPIGDRTYAPVSVSELHDEYNVRIGRLEVDLRDLELPAGDTRVALTAGIGKVVVRVPAGVAVDASADVDYGEAEIFGQEQEGRDSHERVVRPGTAAGEGRLVIDAHASIGRVEITH